MQDQANTQQATGVQAPEVRSAQPEVWVVLYSHRHGDDVSAYGTVDLAYAAVAAIAREWWDDIIPGPFDEIAAALAALVLLVIRWQRAVSAWRGGKTHRKAAAR